MNLPEVYKRPPEEPEAVDMEKHVSQLDRFTDRVEDLEVVDNESLQRAEELLQSLGVVYDIVEEITERFRKPAYEYYQSVLREKKAILARPKEAIDALRNRVQSYMIESGDEDVDNISLRKSSWKARLKEPEHESIELLCKAIARGEAPASLLKLDQREANKLASIFMENMNYPGLDAYQDTSLVVRKG